MQRDLGRADRGADDVPHQRAGRVLQGARGQRRCRELRGQLLHKPRQPRGHLHRLEQLQEHMGVNIPALEKRQLATRDTQDRQR